MIKKPASRPQRPAMRIPTLRPAAQPGWYKRLRQLASRAGKTLDCK